MFKKVLSTEAVEVIADIAAWVDPFYLAGGTGLALQIGHRRSEDFDFFSTGPFNSEVLLNKIQANKVYFVREGTIHCEIRGVKVSFLFYSVPLIYPERIWQGIRIADWRDITAEKFKSISQRGAKKDFYDLYTVLQKKLSVQEACTIFKNRFASTGINLYHVLKSLCFFEEAEEEPNPVLLLKDNKKGWKQVKSYFMAHIKEFEAHLLG